jgi:hypothetical protein
MLDFETSEKNADAVAQIITKRLILRTDFTNYTRKY